MEAMGNATDQHENNSHNKSHYSKMITSHWKPEARNRFAFALPTANCQLLIARFEEEKVTESTGPPRRRERVPSLLSITPVFTTNRDGHQQ